jgi:hypothetical protein
MLFPHCSFVFAVLNKPWVQKQDDGLVNWQLNVDPLTFDIPTTPVSVVINGSYPKTGS